MSAQGRSTFLTSPATAGTARPPWGRQPSAPVVVSAHMPLRLTPRVLRRGLELFAITSLAGVAGLVLYGHDLGVFTRALLTLRWSWLAVGLGLASMDWLGGARASGS